MHDTKERLANIIAGGLRTLVNGLALCPRFIFFALLVFGIAPVVIAQARHLINTA